MIRIGNSRCDTKDSTACLRLAKNVLYLFCTEKKIRAVQGCCN